MAATRPSLGVSRTHKRLVSKVPGRSFPKGADRRAEDGSFWRIREQRSAARMPWPVRTLADLGLLGHLLPRGPEPHSGTRRNGPGLSYPLDALQVSSPCRGRPSGRSGQRRSEDLASGSPLLGGPKCPLALVTPAQQGWSVSAGAKNEKPPVGPRPIRLDPKGAESPLPEDLSGKALAPYG